MSLSPLPLLLLLCAVSASSADSAEPIELAHPGAWEETESWATAGKIAAGTRGEEGKAGNPVSRAEFGDVEIDAVFMIPRSSNSGIYLMERYEVQILDSYGKPDSEISYEDNGGIYQRWDDSRGDTEKEKGFEGVAPDTNASSAPGTWQRFHIVFRAPRFDEDGNKTENARFVRVELNGVIIHEDVEVTGATRGGKGGPEVARAPLMIQGNHGPVAFRKLRVTPVELP